MDMFERIIQDQVFIDLAVRFITVMTRYTWIIPADLQP